MSFRMFVYYCAVIGGWSGLVGWALGRAALLVISRGPSADFWPHVLDETATTLLLGLSIALGLSLLDGIFNYSLRRFGLVFFCVFTGVIVGTCGGSCGGFVGGSLYVASSSIRILAGFTFIVGWTITGFLVGMSVAFYSLVAALISGKDLGNAIKKLIKCVVGGTFGGFLGGLIALGLGTLGSLLNRENLWSPTAIGFVAIGACIGLLIGLAQVILKEAWIRVEAGFRPGREMLLQKQLVTIGRGEGSDIALFGDSGVEKTHAHIVKEGGRFYIVDLQTPGGTYVNDQKVDGKAPLKAGDIIRMGKSLLKFNERVKRTD